MLTEDRFNRTQQEETKRHTIDNIDSIDRCAIIEEIDILGCGQNRVANSGTKG